MICWLMSVMLVAGCTGLTELEKKEESKDEDVWTGPGASQDAACLVTGIDYPADYDWTGGTETESVRCSLVVFADGIPMMKLAVGDGHEVSADPDRHRIIDGHLYTEYCSDGFTMLKKDGKPLLKFEGDESICSMLLNKEDIYTLGVPRDGEGFVYRKNGEVVIERRSGYVFERLNIDQGKICFAFCQPVNTADGIVGRYYIVQGGRINPVEFPDETGKVWDIMSHEGSVIALVSSGPWNTVELIRGTETRASVMPEGAEMISCSLFLTGPDVCVEGMYSYGEGQTACGIWVEGEQYILFETGQDMAAVASSDKDIACVLNPDGNIPTGTVFIRGKTYQLPEGYACLGNCPIGIRDGSIFLGLTSLNGERPILWQDGKSSILKLNGPICNLSVSRP